MTYQRDASLVASTYATTMKSLANELLNAHKRGELKLDDREHDRLVDVRRHRYALTAIDGLHSALRRSNDAGLRERYVVLVRDAVGGTPATTRDPALLGDSETASQGPHDLSWSRFERLLTRGVVCPSLARDVFVTGSAHLAALSAQIAFVLPLIGQ